MINYRHSRTQSYPIILDLLPCFLLLTAIPNPLSTLTFNRRFPSTHSSTQPPTQSPALCNSPDPIIRRILTILVKTSIPPFLGIRVRPIGKDGLSAQSADSSRIFSFESIPQYFNRFPLHPLHTSRFTLRTSRFTLPASPFIPFTLRTSPASRSTLHPLHASRFTRSKRPKNHHQTHPGHTSPIYVSPCLSLIQTSSSVPFSYAKYSSSGSSASGIPIAASMIGT